MQNTNTPAGIPQTGFVRLPTILAHIPVSRSTWWAGVKNHKYPAPVKSLGVNITAWRAEDIHALIARLAQPADKA
jgi:predicted DNA-binding transcriptional regulator AlpA